jgi:NADH-quinone oxidoreductase subunit E
MEKVQKIIVQYPDGPNSIIQILQDIQNEYNYLPREVLDYVAEALHIPVSKVYSVATFYTAFSLKPRGKYHITVCAGTACHVRGAAAIRNEFERKLGIKPSENTPDMKFSLETVNCLGCCAIGPIVVCNGKYHGEFKLRDVARLIEGAK